MWNSFRSQPGMTTFPRVVKRTESAFNVVLMAKNLNDLEKSINQ